MPTEQHLRAGIVPSCPLRAETIIYVTSFIRAKRFYNSVFQCQPEHSDALSGTAEYSLPQRLVTLKATTNPMAGSRDTGLRILVDDFLYEYQRLQLISVKQDGALTESQWGETAMKIVDEDGNIISIVAC